jgi:hypothetical protein
MPRKIRAGFQKYVTAMKLTRGKTCNRKRVLRAVKGGASPEAAVRQHCSGFSGVSKRSKKRGKR